jgi:His Kinase A (phospho-acceptor) domain
MQDWLEHFAETAFRRNADTAHDLKTPLNVAVLNLELLRMRLAKLVEQPDEKLTAYAASIELELRRMARIFDTFFLLSTPPKNEAAPGLVDAAAFVPGAEGPALVRGHESRIREAFKLFFEGVSRLLSEGRKTTWRRVDGKFEVTVEGEPQAQDFELTKIFKFYYSGPDGNPDLSLATARLVAETYGGELIAGEEHDKVWVRLTFPLDEK